MKGNFTIVALLISILITFMCSEKQEQPEQINFLNLQNIPEISLEFVRSIGDELGDNQYLFKPGSVVRDTEGNLYIFDIFQHKILKVNKSGKFIISIGSKGPGPGEFAGGSIYLSIGGNNNLYAWHHDNMRLLEYDMNGNFKKEYDLGDYLYSLTRKARVVDSIGNVYLYSVDDRKMKFFNQNGEHLFSIQSKPEWFNFLYAKFNDISFIRPEHMISFFIDEESNQKVLFFEPSSTLVLIDKDNRIINEKQIIPKNAYEHYIQGRLMRSKGGKKEKSTIQEFHSSFTPFPRGVLFDSEKKRIYIRFVFKNEKIIPKLVCLNFSGNVLKVIRIIKDLENQIIPISFEAKSDEYFFARGIEKLHIYKEKKNE